MASTHVIEVNLGNFAEAVVAESHRRPVLVDFWAPWCGPCRALGPVLEKLADEMGGAFLLAKINSDENPDLSRRYSVRGIPAVKAFRNGNVIDEFTGALPESAVRQFLSKVLPQPGDELRVTALQALAQGREEEAESLLRQALEIAPQNDEVRLELARILLGRGDHPGAQKQIEAMSPSFQMNEPVEALRALLEFAAGIQDAPSLAELEQAIQNHTGDERAKALYQHALRLLLQGQEQAAMDDLINMVQKHRSYGDDLGRKTLLKVFLLLGKDHPLVNEYRSKLSRALY